MLFEETGRSLQKSKISETVRQSRDLYVCDCSRGTQGIRSLLLLHASGLGVGYESTICALGTSYPLCTSGPIDHYCSEC